MENTHAAHADGSGVSTTLGRVALAGAAAGGAIILAPHVLPALGIGHMELAEASMHALYKSAEAGGSGLAGLVNSGLAQVPLVGEQLAAGGLFNAGATALVGLGGVGLGKYVARSESGDGFKWGKAIQYAALATSALIALPTALTALGSGVIFLSTVVGTTPFVSEVIRGVDNTLGTMGKGGDTLMGFSGAAAALPHLLTCGVAVLPAALSFGIPDEVGPAQAVQSHVSLDAPLEAGKPVQAKLKLTDAHGAPIGAEDLAVTHTQKLHLLVVDSSLRDYRHIHPVPTDEKGVFSFSFTPKVNTDYSAWADFALTSGQSHQVKAGLPSAAHRQLPPVVRLNSQAEAGGMQFSWQADGPLTQGQGRMVEVAVTDANGQPVRDLEPVMGAYAHLVGFSADGKSLLHAHPLGAEPKNADERGGPVLQFHLEPESAGQTQFYLQVKRGGEEVYVPFGQHIKAERGMLHQAGVQAVNIAH